MSLLPHQLELLSPARDANIGIEAINHGADAVYIGGPARAVRILKDRQKPALRVRASGAYPLAHVFSGLRR